MVGTLWDYDDSSHRVMLRTDTYRSNRRRKRRSEQITVSLLNRPRLIVLVVILVALVFLFLREGRYALANYTQFQIERVIIGKAKYINTSTINKLLRIKNSDTLLNVSAKKLAERLEKDPDIVKVSVEKEFPRTIKISIKERFPSIRVKTNNGVKYFDSQGILLMRSPENIYTPLVMGLNLDKLKTGELCSDADLATVLKIVNTGKKLQLDNYLSVNRVYMSSPNRIELKTKERITIVMKDKDIDTQLKKLMLVLNNVQDRGELIKNVDLRFKDVSVE